MRHVSLKLLAIAAGSALIALPAERAGAQAPSTSADTIKTKIGLGAYVTTCSDAQTGPGTLTSTSCTQTAVPNDHGTYDAKAVSTVTPGTSIFLQTAFKDNPGQYDVSMISSGEYFRFFTFAGSGIDHIVFHSAISATAVTPDPVALAPSAGAQFGWGLLNGDNTIQGLTDQVGCSVTVPAGPPATACGSSLDLTVNVSDLGSATSFYLDLAAQAYTTVGHTDPDGGIIFTMLDPGPLGVDFFDVNGNTVTPDSFSYDAPPVTGTPEPASLALMGTGLAGIAGFARRKRRNATNA